MSIISDEMDRLKKDTCDKVEAMGLGINMAHFKLGYVYGMDDARRIRDTIKRLAAEALEKP